MQFIHTFYDRRYNDPNRAAKLLPRDTSDDNLRPNDAGYHAMANAVDLTLLKTGK